MSETRDHRPGGRRKKRSETSPKPAVELDRSFGESLRRLRRKRGYSQEALAHRAELHRTEVGLLENGQRNPGFEVITMLAGALGVDAGEFFRAATFVPSEAGPGHFTYDPEKHT